jgi:hypothetical protein
MPTRLRTDPSINPGCQGERRIRKRFFKKEQRKQALLFEKRSKNFLLLGSG